jgi:hypothetical protein
MCIRYGAIFFTEPLPSNDRRIFTEPLLSNSRGIHIETHRLMGGIFNSGRCDGLRCRNICTKFHIDSFRHSKVNRAGGYTAVYPRR